MLHTCVISSFSFLLYIVVLYVISYWPPVSYTQLIGRAVSKFITQEATVTRYFGKGEKKTVKRCDFFLSERRSCMSKELSHLSM